MFNSYSDIIIPFMNKLYIFLTLLISSFVGMSQSITKESETPVFGEYYNITNGEIYYLYHKGKLSELHSIKLGEHQINKRKLPAIFEYINEMIVEGDYMYVASTHYAHKYNLSDFTEIWKVPTDSKMMPQCPPQIYGDRITYAYDDRIFVINKNSGQL